MSSVTEREERLILEFIHRGISTEEFARAFMVEPDQLGRFALDLLKRSAAQQDGIGVELSLSLGFRFGITPEYLDILLGLATADWHQRHEDVVSALDDLRAPQAVATLFQTALARHEYLDYDEAYALGVKSIWALGNIGTVEAVEALRRLLHSENEILQENARKQLERLEKNGATKEVRTAATKALQATFGSASKTTAMTSADQVPPRQIRAAFSRDTLRVYQAFSPEIARPAVATGKFVPPFRRSRMTWIKPSFTWMMYRSGWATKPGQERVLGIDILRTGFEWALAHSCLSRFEPDLHGTFERWQEMLREAPVRVQWDPERSLRMEPLPWRTIQVGLGREAVDAYVDEWVVGIEDVTETAREVHAVVVEGDLERARRLLPVEMPYPLPEEIARRIMCSR